MALTLRSRKPRAAAVPKPAAPAARGRFISFEGGEGAGKSTQVRRLGEKLRSLGFDVVMTREPGGSPGAEAVRHVLLSGAAKPLGPVTEAMLFAAARADHVGATIRPALERGAFVICDRFVDSTRVYQGALGNVDPRLIRALERVTVGPTIPDLTIVLDLPAAEGLRRASARSGAGADRFESEDVTFHRHLRDAFRELAEREPERCVLVDAGGDADGVADTVWRLVETRLLKETAVRGGGG